MKAVESDGFADKEKVNMHLDSVKLKDLEFLKAKGVCHLSRKKQIYLQKMIKIDMQEKKQRFEARYVKNSSLRLKHSDHVFRLRRDNKNLSNKECSENLKTYFGIFISY